MDKEIGKAYLCHIGRSLIYGSTLLFTSHLLKTMGVFDVLALRFLLGTICFLLLAAFRVVRVSFKGKHLLMLVLLSLLEPIADFILETVGLQGITTSLAGILAAVSPVGVVILETLLLGERINGQQRLFLALGIIGTVITSALSVGGGQNTWWGILCMFGSYTFGAMFCVVSRKASAEFTSVEMTFFITAVGAAVFNGISLTQHLRAGTLNQYFAPLLDWKNLVGLLFLGIGSSVLATIMNTYALARVQASHLSVLGGLTTIISVVLGVTVNHEQLRWYHIVGGILILTGAIGVNWISLRQKQLLVATAETQPTHLNRIHKPCAPDDNRPEATTLTLNTGG